MRVSGRLAKKARYRGKFSRPKEKWPTREDFLQEPRKYASELNERRWVCWSALLMAATGGHVGVVEPESWRSGETRMAADEGRE
jgi:hypothetical protein